MNHNLNQSNVPYNSQHRFQPPPTNYQQQQYVPHYGQDSNTYGRIPIDARQNGQSQMMIPYDNS